MIDGFKITKEIEPGSDPSSNFKGMQRTENNCWIAPYKNQTMKIPLKKKKWRETID